MDCYHLAAGIAIRDGRLLMVASRYPSHPAPLWNLPGGRQLPGELLAETVIREVFEETGVRAEAGELAYVSESYDGERHFLSATFVLELCGEAPLDSARGDRARDHVVEVGWVPLAEVGGRIVVAVVREPLLAYLNRDLSRRYAGFHEAGITIEWPADSQ
ncbi:MAG: NUDIX domain-containing protein [Candidatus Eremiobacteraeota bacterium]|nr:NUDIX domain-containing protein [Candidatus Eremiobacteraeota bacterium]